MEKPSMIDEIAFPDKINLFDNSMFQLSPLPNFNKNLDFIKYLNPSKETSLSYFSGTSFNSGFPF